LAIKIFSIAVYLAFYHFSSYQWQNRLNARPLYLPQVTVFQSTRNEVASFMLRSVCEKVQYWTSSFPASVNCNLANSSVPVARQAGEVFCRSRSEKCTDSVSVFE